MRRLLGGASLALLLSAQAWPATAAPAGAPPPSSSSSAPDATGPARARELVIAGKKAFAAGDHAGAWRLFADAADADPTHPTALYNAALSARKAGLLDEAGAIYRRLLTKAPDDLDVIYGLAEVERGLGHADAARALYERFIAGETRPERAELRARARAALDTLPQPAPTQPTPTQPTPTPAPPVLPAPSAPAQPSPPPAASPAPALPAASSSVPHAWRAEAEALFAEGVALVQVGRHGDAAAKFNAAAARDPGRVDALLRAGLSFRRAGDLPGALDAYGRAVAHAGATTAERLDATYGLAETHRLKGNVDEAIDLFTRYVTGETRVSELRFVERARAAIIELRRTRDPSASPAPTSVPFFGDALVVEGLVAEAAALRAAGDDPGAAARLARARGIAPDDPRVPATPPALCDADALLSAGEAALAKQDAPRALTAFQQARACDPTRAAPLWGLSRAADLGGDRPSGRAHARRYLQARAPDHDAAIARAAFLRSEQP